MKPNQATSLLTAALTILAAGTAQAQSSLFSYSIVGVSNTGSNGLQSLNEEMHTNSSTSFAHANQSFTGLDGNNQQQTMTFDGTTVTQATYAGLHSYTTGTVTNSYYNANNPVYVDGGNNVNPNGSPETLASLGFATFTDTLHYGGSLSAGYKARYIFHVDGTNTGMGYLADLAFNVEGYQGEAFFAYDPGYNNNIWATQSYDVNGITPQHISVQFSTQFVVDTFAVADGGTYSGTCDFSSTLTLAGIEMLDANGNTVDPSTWSVASDSGTVYNAVPEPFTLLGLAAFVPFFKKRKR